METPKKKYGIQGLILLVSLGLSFENARKKTMADGEAEWHEASNFASPLMQTFTGLNKLKEVPAEIADLDDVESIQLYSKIANDFNIPESQIDEKIKSGIRLGLEAYRFFQIVTGKHPDFPKNE